MFVRKLGVVKQPRRGEEGPQADSSREESMTSYLIPPHLACPLSGEPLVEPVVIVGVHAPEMTPTLRLGECSRCATCLRTAAPGP